MTNRQRSHVFRVTGLSADQSDENIETSLRNTLNEELTPEERSRIQAKITIVPSCYEPDTRRVALMEMGDGEDNDVNFDSHFFGFTQLYAPREKPVVADIIAIAGLDGHAYGSWQGRGKFGRMWLRDFLSKDLPRCRTMIYGYNSKLSSHGVDTILDYGRELMGEIKQVRNTKECLVKALQTMDDDHPAITSLHRATYGMILFAIPYKGLVIDDIQQMLSKGENKSRQQLLQQISEKSDLLVNQLADFKNLIRDRKVVSFYETGQTRQLDSESQRWRRTGDFITTVNAESALLQLPDHVEDKVPLSADHSMIIKFDTRDAAGYRTALDRLRQFVEDAPRVVAARFVQARHRPPVASTVPFKRDPEFVGREGILDEIKKRHAGLGQRHERVALVGLAGVGKSQTAIEYSYRVRESAPDMWVFWVHASNSDRFEQGYQQITSVGEIPGRDSPKTNILQLVYQWLCDLRNGHWLMVLDNADDDTMFFDADDSNSQGPLVKFLPQVAHGLILITSRNRLAAMNLVGSYSNVIDILPMREEESLALLRTKIPISQQASEGEKALVQALEHIPLAIIQAGSYIASRSTRFTVGRYLQLFQESETKQTHLLKQEDAKDLRRDTSIRHSVITTWQLSFEQIRHSHQIATELLALMSMFDRQSIPEYLVQEDYETLQFEDALAPLISYSLIRSGIEGRLFEIHRLVQLSVRVWLDIHNELEQWQEKSRGIMAQMLPNGDYENWVQCQELLPHAREVMKPSVQNDVDELNRASISVNCGWYLLVRGAFADAEVMHRQALETRTKVLGPEHPTTLDSVCHLGLVLANQGKYEEAEAMHRQALETRTKVLGLEHPSTLNSVNNLGLVLADQGKYEEAEAMHDKH
ncbi:P-loop containing nucleoside triphosphate hydrolase protein [Aspergillus terricola var. indicus]